jgi:hypothetical protein
MAWNWINSLIPYRVILSGSAQDDLRKLFNDCPSAVPFVRSQLNALAQNPTSLSRRSHFPYRERCQLMSFDMDLDGTRHFFTVIFQYGSDEQTIEVADTAHQSRKIDDLWEP